MNQNEFNILLDKLIIKAASPKDYELLSEKQKIVGALEMLIGTTTRSGVEVFFENNYRYLWGDALRGLKEVKAASSERNYKLAMNEMSDENFKALQDAIVIDDFEVLYSGVRNFIADSPEILKPNL